MNRFSGSRVGHSTRLLVNLIKADIQQTVVFTTIENSVSTFLDVFIAALEESIFSKKE